MEKYPEWYDVYEVEVSVRDLLGSLPADPGQLKYVKEIYKAKTGEERAEGLMDSGELREEEAAEEKIAGRCIFRRNEEGALFISQGQIVGWLEESVKAANLSRTIRNIPLTFWTDPARIIMLKEGRPVKEADLSSETIRPIRGFIGGKFQTSLAIHEKISEAKLKFNVLTTNKQFTEENAETIFDLAKRVNIGPGRTHGFGEIINLVWKKM